MILLCQFLVWPQGPSWWHTHLSTKMDSSTRDPGGWFSPPSYWPLPTPPPSTPISLHGSTVLLIRVSCCETAQANSYYPAWPRWVVSVSGPLAVLSMTTKMYIKSQQYLKLQQREKGIKLWIPSYNSAVLATCEKYDEESVKRFARKMIVMQLFYLQWSSLLYVNTKVRDILFL